MKFEKASISRIISFLKTDIWRIRSRDLSGKEYFLIRVLRVLILTIRGVTEDKCMLRASALTFYSLLSIVPVVAMVFGIAKGFGFEKTLEDLLYKNFVGQEQIIARVVDFAQATLENVKGGLVAGIGLFVLFYTIIKILSHIENAFNDIWGVRRSRSFGRKITDYLSLTMITPILFIMSSALTVIISSSARLVIEKIPILGAISPAIFLPMKLLSYCALWVLFTFLYIFLPNARINFKSGALGGIIAGTMYQLFQWIYIHFQIGVAKYNAIYGSFAALPLFFIWLQLSWIIVLFGAELAFAHQNVDTYEFEQDCLNISQSFKRLLSLMIVHLLVKQFHRGGRAWDETQISHELDIPIRLVRQIMYDLVTAGVVAEIKVEEGRNIAYQPARDPEKMTIKSVMDALEGHGSDNIPVVRSKELEGIEESLKTFSDILEASPANVPLKNI
ncbi:MAG: YihY family inner membrane protein [Deltaproteobacteria bacterium]|nr:YihY family inner membrane protein [Deltaproteobacteria bacterium]